MHKRLQKEIEDIIEIARESGDVELFSELVHLKAIAISEHGLMTATFGESAFQNGDSACFNHPSFQATPDTCISDVRNQCGKEPTTVAVWRPIQKSLEDQV
jgi:hypothetical protein